MSIDINTLPDGTVIRWSYGGELRWTDRGGVQPYPTYVGVQQPWELGRGWIDAVYVEVPPGVTFDDAKAAVDALAPDPDAARVEAMARAMAEGALNIWDEMTEEDRSDFVEGARDALTALREFEARS